MRTELEEAYGFLFDKELINEIAESGTIKKAAAGVRIIEIGDYVTVMPLLLDGAIKILREDNDGNELLIYFLERGDTCAMTLNCCLGRTKSEIRAVAENDTTLIMIPISKMEEWTAKYKSWRNFVFESYHTRLSEMLDTIDTIAFLNMDERLMRYLRDKGKVNSNEIIQSTHQEIAYDLNTSRVVVSRLLKKLENEGKISLKRNNITVIDL
ncbi:Crp/Fnr family transcriptional regulator [Christiangramia forsetii]|uniref:Crp family transcriptional regulator protein n=2 Tax=Christiangramia forsetii TaxID=411153 RepID=A0LZY8_CHRFK|nr:Crp/Fnr family transcriptional regulator [Christiangramia forsetii]GGG45642.1 Crp/Fnr family transcriptional regulator [Christiangramia forsetii]CAL65933.1 Crp family transcriptional regulator protein [Christiangramia forsetii KT0803]